MVEILSFSLFYLFLVRKVCVWVQAYVCEVCVCCVFEAASQNMYVYVVNWNLTVRLCIPQGTCTPCVKLISHTFYEVIDGIVRKGRA